LGGVNQVLDNFFKQAQLTRERLLKELAYGEPIFKTEEIPMSKFFMHFDTTLLNVEAIGSAKVIDDRLHVFGFSGETLVEKQCEDAEQAEGMLGDIIKIIQDPSLQKVTKREFVRVEENLIRIDLIGSVKAAGEKVIITSPEGNVVLEIDNDDHADAIETFLSFVVMLNEMTQRDTDWFLNPIAKKSGSVTWNSGPGQISYTTTDTNF